jgi:hypothetical protein
MKRILLALAILLPAVPAFGLRVAVEGSTSANVRGRYGSPPSNAVYEIAALCSLQGWTYRIVQATEIDQTSELSQFDVVVTGDCGHGDNDMAAFDDTLLKWIRQGGGLVTLGWVIHGIMYGSIAPGAWSPMDTANAGMCVSSYGYVGSGTVHITNGSHPITQGVGDFSVYHYGEAPAAGLWPGAVSLGNYSASPTLNSIACKSLGSGRSVYLGPIYYGNFGSYANRPYYTDPNSARLLKQAIQWAGPSGDVGVTAIKFPFGAVDSGLPIVPACSVRNNTPEPASYRVRMKIGTFYNDSAEVFGHPGLSYQYVTFPVWSAWPRGKQIMRCSTMLAGDVNPFNDRKLDSIMVFVHDVGATAVKVPTGIIDSGTTVIPACSVYNYGSVPENYLVRMRIGTSINLTAMVGVSPPGEYQYVTFAPWVALPPGRLAVSCSTELPSDVNRNDDRKKDSVFVRVQDVGTAAIVGPSGTIDSGTATTPQALIHNYGNAPATYDAVFTTDDGYADTLFNQTTGPGASATLSFGSWIPRLRGTRALKCSTRFAGDVNPGNDRAEGGVDVAVHDAGVTAITSPAGTIPPGPIQPSAAMRNYGTAREPVTVTFRIPGVPPYENTVPLPGGLPLGRDTAILFLDWDALEGSYTARCSVHLVSDQVRGNDTLTLGFIVGTLDVGVLQIIEPVGRMDTSMPISPAAKVKNFGSVPATFRTFFSIEGLGDQPVYLDSARITGLLGGDSMAVSFRPWPGPHPPLRYTTRCSTFLAGDNNRANDVRGDSFTIFTPPPAETGWVRKADVPTGGRRKNVKDGACLAYNEESDAAGYIYALKGNNTGEFYQYGVETNAWAAKESIPPVGSSGKKKLVKKGACITQAEGRLYAAKGNNTLEFWEYSPSDKSDPSDKSYPWGQKADVPTGQRNVKEGAGSVSVMLGDTTYVYLLKGSSTQEFHRYNVLSNAWQTMAAAPAGLSGKPFKNGSCLAFDGEKLIYALKGSYNEFYAYHVDSDFWETKAALPLIGGSGRKKKVKDGAGLAVYGATAYALKGGNTPEFWLHQRSTDQWTQGPDLPLGGGKKVKGGGALVLAGSARDGATGLYALKGNNTLEFYDYPLTDRLWLAACRTQPAASPSQGMSASCEPLGAGRLLIAPNPFSGVATISYSLPKPGNIRLKLYDVTGAFVTTLTSGYHNAGSYSFTVVPAGTAKREHRSSLACGIYLLKLESEGYTVTSKLTIE